MCPNEKARSKILQIDPTTYRIPYIVRIKSFLFTTNAKNLKIMLPKMLEDDSDVLSLSSKSDGGDTRSASSKTSSMTDTTGVNASDAPQSELAQQETRLVKRSKALVFFVLLAAAAGCGAGKSLLSLD
jgi:hypothetical protein